MGDALKKWQKRLDILQNETPEQRAEAQEDQAVNENEQVDQNQTFEFSKDEQNDCQTLGPAPPEPTSVPLMDPEAQPDEDKVRFIYFN
jgi:hypothetical protein